MCDRVTHLIKKRVVQAPSVLETAEIFVKTAKRPFWKANGHFSCDRVPCELIPKVISGTQMTVDLRKVVGFLPLLEKQHFSLHF